MKVIYKKNIIIGGIIFIFIFLIGIIILCMNIKIEKVEEIEPEGEISNEDIKTINITGYYYNKETNQIVSKECLVNREELLIDLYENLLLKIMEDNSDEMLLSINEIVKLNLKECRYDSGNIKVYFDNSIDEFNSLDLNMKKTIIQIIEKTLKEINEIRNVEIFFNNEMIVVE